jgi:hypothetical protein
MKKLRMDLDDLEVESFETRREEGKEADREGTVRAHYGGQHTLQACSETTCVQFICDCSMGPTDCDYSCPGYWNAAAASCAPFEC